MKKTALFLLFVFCMSLAACSKDAEVNAFMTENHAVIEDMVKKIDANPSKAGVADAQKSFDSKKDGLKAKWDAIKNARKAQVGSEVTKKLTDSMNADVKMLTDVQQKHAMKLAGDGDAMKNFSKLMQDYLNTVSP